MTAPARTTGDSIALEVNHWITLNYGGLVQPGPRLLCPP